MLTLSTLRAVLVNLLDKFSLSRKKKNKKNRECLLTVAVFMIFLSLTFGVELCRIFVSRCLIRQFPVDKKDLSDFASFWKEESVCIVVVCDVSVGWVISRLKMSSSPTGIVCGIFAN